MSRYTVYVHVMPRRGVLDPPGEATRSALQALGFAEVAAVRIGRRIAVEVEAESESQALERVRAMADRLLANPVVEEFELSLNGAVPGAPAAVGAARAQGRPGGRPEARANR
ncbi:MAG: phosphoribosylformylglycinamidine synthase subunit PurS [Bacillota bacterium]